MPNPVNPPLATDDLSPMTVGDLFPIWNPTCQDRFGNAIDLTGVTNVQLSLHMKNEATGAAKTGAGTFSITNAPAGQFTYAWASADTNTAGEWLLQVTINWNNTQPQHSDLYALVINPAL